MPNQKCNYFNRNFGNDSRIDLTQGGVYCACADIIKKKNQEIARSACPFQIGNFEQPWFSRVTYWQCGIGQELFNGRDKNFKEDGIFAAARSYKRSIVGNLFH